MGDDKYETIEATPVTYFGKNYSFHIEKEFPLSKNGIIGLSFFNDSQDMQSHRSFQ